MLGDVSTLPLSLRAVEDTLAFTEREVLDAGQCLERILSENQLQLKDLGSIETQLSSGAPGTLGDVLGALLAFIDRTIGAYESLGGGVTELSSRAVTAEGGANEIVRLVKQIQAISDSSRLLAINARIEAARESANPKALAALADGMKSLSQEVSGAATSIESFGEGMAEILVEIGRRSQEMAGSCRIGAEELHSRRQALGASCESANGLIAKVLATSKSRGERVRAEYFGVLSHMQFLDVLRARLRPLSEELTRLDHVANGARELADDPSLSPTELRDRLRALVGAQSNPTVAVAAAPAQPEGEVQFF
jgi:hypothetical protein